jgi:hypothetical protein
MDQNPSESTSGSNPVGSRAYFQHGPHGLSGRKSRLPPLLTGTRGAGPLAASTLPPDVCSSRLGIRHEAALCSPVVGLLCLCSRWAGFGWGFPWCGLSGGVVVGGVCRVTAGADDTLLDVGVGVAGCCYWLQLGCFHAAS